MIGAPETIVETSIQALPSVAMSWTKAERRLLHRVNISRRRGAKVNWDSLLRRLPGRTKDQVQRQMDAQLATAPPARQPDKVRQSG